MNILITGANGQLGNEFRMIAQQQTGVNFVFSDLPELDICNITALEEFVSKNKIDTIINCAAYTAVDKAETEVEMAYMINRDALYHIGKVAAERGIKVIHISTDYVFDGKHFRPYKETDKPNPTSIYGKSKLDGEETLLEVNPNAIIVRTSWLYSSFGNNFVKTMLRLSEKNDSIRVIVDQIGTPTYAEDLANAIFAMVRSEATQCTGVYHYTNEGVSSWYDFAVAIFRNMQKEVQVVPITTEEYPTPATRPFYSVLSKSRIKTDIGIEIPHWQDGLRRCLNKL